MNNDLKQLQINANIFIKNNELYPNLKYIETKQQYVTFYFDNTNIESLYVSKDLIDNYILNLHNDYKDEIND